MRTVDELSTTNGKRTVSPSLFSTLILARSSASTTATLLLPATILRLNCEPLSSGLNISAIAGASINSGTNPPTVNPTCVGYQQFTRYAPTRSLLRPGRTVCQHGVCRSAGEQRRGV